MGFPEGFGTRPVVHWSGCVSGYRRRFFPLPRVVSVLAFLLFARRSAYVVGAMTCHLVKPKSSLMISTFYQKSRKRHRLFRVTQRDTDEPNNVSVRFAPGQKSVTQIH